MIYQRLSEASQARIRAALVHTTGGRVSAKLQRALEADHLARTLLGEDVAPVEDRMAELERRPGRST